MSQVNERMAGSASSVSWDAIATKLYHKENITRKIVRNECMNQRCCCPPLDKPAAVIFSVPSIQAHLEPGLLNFLMFPLQWGAESSTMGISSY